MQVDHFNPNLKKNFLQDYVNLFLSTSHCNGSKSDRWPTNKERAKGWRFLDCTKEIDYGVHIFASLAETVGEFIGFRKFS
jgi:hypothetical protein